MKDLINEMIQMAIINGKPLSVVQSELNNRKIQVDISTLKQRADNIIKKKGLDG
jgi:hypothetical protein